MTPAPVAIVRVHIIGSVLLALGLLTCYRAGGCLRNFFKLTCAVDAAKKKVDTSVGSIERRCANGVCEERACCTRAQRAHNACQRLPRGDCAEVSARIINPFPAMFQKTWNRIAPLARPRLPRGVTITSRVSRSLATLSLALRELPTTARTTQPRRR